MADLLKIIVCQLLFCILLIVHSVNSTGSAKNGENEPTMSANSEPIEQEDDAKISNKILLSNVCAFSFFNKMFTKRKFWLNFFFHNF